MGNQIDDGQRFCVDVYRRGHYFKSTTYFSCRWRYMPSCITLSSRTNSRPAQERRQPPNVRPPELTATKKLISCSECRGDVCSARLRAISIGLPDSEQALGRRLQIQPQVAEVSSRARRRNRPRRAPTYECMLADAYLRVATCRPPSASAWPCEIP